jgi:hypothetical protein
MSKRKKIIISEKVKEKLRGVFKEQNITKEEELKGKSKTRYFKVIKRGQTKAGKKFVFCQSHGKGVLIEESMAKALELNFGDDVFNIPVDKIFINKTDKEDIFKLFLKVPPYMWYGLENLRDDLEDGISYEEFQKAVNEADLETQEVVHSKFGRFIAVRPGDGYRIDDRHRINIYPGNSVKNFGFGKMSLLEFIEKNKNRLTFKSFEQGDKIYNRFYLRKVKNSFVRKARPTKSEESSDATKLEKMLEPLKSTKINSPTDK